MNENPATFYIPENYDLNILPERLRQCAAFVLNQVHWRWCRRRADDNGFVRLSWKLLTRFVPRKLLRPVLSHLQGFPSYPPGSDTSYPVVLETDLAVPGVKCRGYRLAKHYRRGQRTVCTDDGLNERIRKVSDESRRSLLPVHRWLERSLERLTFDMPRARSIIADLIPTATCKLTPEEYREQFLAHSLRLESGDHYLRRDKYGRVHTLVTSLKRDLRCCLSVAGQPLVGLDLKNSQPLIAGMCARRFFASKDSRNRLGKLEFKATGNPYARKIVRGNAWRRDLPEDVIKYIRRCESGTFYESFMPPGENKTRFKKRFFAKVFFGKDRARSRIRTAFKTAYPSMARMIHSLKSRDYRRAAWIMQNHEASIFIFLICGRIMKERPDLPIYTIHDSILTIPGEVEYVRSVILDEFKKLGVSPTLEEEHYR